MLENNRPTLKAHPLEDNQLMRLAPSIFADKPFKDVSERYGFIPTIQVVNSLRKEGWFPVSAKEQFVRKEEKKGYAKHMIRFQRDTTELIVGDVAPQICMVNSHDRSSGYKLMAALWRLACLNGLMVSESSFASISVHHSKRIVEEVIKGSFDVAREFPLITDRIKEMSEVILEPEEKDAFALTAIQAKYNLGAFASESENEVEEAEIVEPEIIPVTPYQVLIPRRRDDDKDDVWHVYNRIQENLMKGGQNTYNPKTDKYRKARGVKSVQKDLSLNKTLWSLAENMVKFHNNPNLYK